MRNGAVRFAKAEEAAYPLVRCETIVHRLRDKALQCGATAPETLFEQAEGPDPSPLTQIVLGALPRGHRVKPLVAEFGTYLTVFANPQKPDDLEKFLTTLPKGAKAVSCHNVTGGDLQAARLFFSMSMTIQLLKRSTLGPPVSQMIFLKGPS